MNGMVYPTMLEDQTVLQFFLKNKNNVLSFIKDNQNIYISICIYFSHILIIWKCRGETTIAIWPTNATGTPDHARSQDNVSCVVLLYKLSLVNKRFESCLEKLSFRSNVRLTEEMRTANAIQLHRLNI